MVDQAITTLRVTVARSGWYGEERPWKLAMPLKEPVYWLGCNRSSVEEEVVLVLLTVLLITLENTQQTAVRPRGATEFVCFFVAPMPSRKAVHALAVGNRTKCPGAMLCEVVFKGTEKNVQIPGQARKRIATTNQTEMPHKLTETMPP